MTYAEAFDWIEDNIELEDVTDFNDFLVKIRSRFPPEAAGLINALESGVEIEDFKTGLKIQKTLEEFFEQLRPQD